MRIITPGKVEVKEWIHACSKCKHDYNATHRMGDEHHPEKYMDIMVVERVADAVKCRCNQCGHEYMSRSRSAYGAIEKRSN